MKKSLLFILASLFAVFTLAGCADDSNDDAASGTNLPVEYVGTYNVTFFGSQVTNVRGTDNSFMAGMANTAYISNDCKKAKELYPDIIGKDNKNDCSDKTQSTMLEGKVVITEKGGKLYITSKMQMEDGAVNLSTPDKYQYTEYYPTASNTGKGVKGWNYDAAGNKPSSKPSEFPESPYTITKQSDGTLRIDMTLVGKNIDILGTKMTVDAKNTILIKKDSNKIDKLENKITHPFKPVPPAI